MTRFPSRCVRTDREGQTLAVVAVSMVGLLAIMSLGIDLGMAYTARAEAQRVADAAALAGASVFMVNPPQGGYTAAAEARAREFAAMNTVRNRPVDPDDDVMVWVQLAEGKVRVRVERRGLPTWFARFIGQDHVTVSALAAAQVIDTGAAECLKPWAVVDLFHRNNQRPPAEPPPVYGADGSDYYQANVNNPQNPPTGLGTLPGDLGTPVTIHTNNPQNAPAPSVFMALRLPTDDTQASCVQGGGQGIEYRNNICSCNKTGIGIGDLIDKQPGNVVGHTNHGMRNLMASDPGLYWQNGQVMRPGQYTANGEPEVVSQSDRIVNMILISPAEALEPGAGTVQVTNIVKFFIEDYVEKGNDGEVKGRFYGPVQGVTGGNTTSPLVKTLRLVE
jgi:hypothetical protein